MREYSTYVVLGKEIADKTAFYRDLLFKTEFGTYLEDVCFITEDSADEKTSAELRGVKNYLYLYGLTDTPGYKEKYDEIEKKRFENPNPNYYMIFCQNKYCACGSYNAAGGNDRRTFSVGIIDDDILSDSEGSDKMREDIRILKLISFAMAICICNSGSGEVLFNNYYMTATVQLNVQNIYYLILYEMSGYVELINQKKNLIKANKEIIEILKNRKPKKCRGNFPQEDENLYEELPPLSKYDDMEKLRHDMEFTYDNAEKKLTEKTSEKIEIARRALAVAEKEANVECEIDDITGKVTVTDKDFVAQKYMSMETIEGKDMPACDDLLDIVDTGFAFDAQKLRNLLPLAREFDKCEKLKTGKLFLMSLCIILFFALGVCSIYGVRYFAFGLKEVTQRDLHIMSLLPALAVLVVFILSVILVWINKIKRKNIFKELYKSLQKFLRKLKQRSKEITEYINKYLTVYYNYHLNNSKIDELNREIVLFEKEIETYKTIVLPLNDTADAIFYCTKDSIEKIDSQFGENDLKDRKISDALRKTICENVKTSCRGSNALAEISNPWISGISFEVGNINGGAQ